MVTTFTNLVKSATTYVNEFASGILGYLVTHDSSFILVGSAEDEFLIWQEDITWNNQSKN